MEDNCQYHQNMLNPRPLPETVFWQRVNGVIANLFGTTWQKTFYGLIWQVNQLCHQDQSLKALQLLLEALGGQRYWFNHASKWWHLMRLSLDIAKDLPVKTGDRFNETLQRILKFATNAPQPWQGFDVSYSFATFSLWCYQMNKWQNAVYYAKTAIHADHQWGYPEYLLGWYGLRLEGIDPIPHFARAVQLNPEFYTRLQRDPLCKEFPEILQAIRQKLRVAVD